MAEGPKKKRGRRGDDMGDEEEEERRGDDMGDEEPRKRMETPGKTDPSMGKETQHRATDARGYQEYWTPLLEMGTTGKATA